MMHDASYSSMRPCANGRVDEMAGTPVHELSSAATDADRRSSLHGNIPIVLRGMQWCNKTIQASSGMTVKAYREYKSAVVIAGCVSSWPATSAWQGDAGLARMAQLAGDAPVQVHALHGGIRAVPIVCTPCSIRWRTQSVTTAG
jgi:hypothetical protein